MVIPITNFNDYLDNVAINANGEINLFENSNLSIDGDGYYYENEHDGILLAQIKTEITPKLIRLNYNLVDDVDLLLK